MYMGGGVGRREGGGVYFWSSRWKSSVAGKYLNMYSLTAVALAATACSYMPAEQNERAPNRNLIYRHSYDNVVS